MFYVRFPLSFWNLEDLLHERMIKVSHEIVNLAFFWGKEQQS